MCLLGLAWLGLAWFSFVCLITNTFFLIKNTHSHAHTLTPAVEDELVKIVRVGMRTRRTDSTSSLMMETENPSQASSSEFSQQILSGVRFAPLLENPRIPSVLPSKIWDPSVHHNYPDSFRNSCREILLCSHASRVQGPPPIEPKETLNAACLLPRVLWMEVLSYTHRDCKYKKASTTTATI